MPKQAVVKIAGTVTELFTYLFRCPPPFLDKETITAFPYEIKRAIQDSAREKKD